MRITYAAYVRMDPAKREKVRELLEKSPPSDEERQFLMELGENDHDPAVRQFAQDRLHKIETMSRQSKNTIDKKRSRTSLGTRGCQVLGGLIIAVAIVGGIGIAILSVVNPDVLDNLIGGLSGSPIKQTQAISGDPSHFDPYKSLAEAQAFAAKDAQLISITAEYVRADGTMDLTATYSPAPNTEYKFVHQVAPPANAPPVGAGGNVSGIWYEPVTITAYQPGKRESIYESNGNSSVSYQFVNDGYSRETDDPISKLSDPIIAAPHCDLAQLWKVAIKNYDAPPNSVATIDYTANGYDFSIADTNVSITFDTNCQDTSTVPPTLAAPDTPIPQSGG